MLWNEFIEGTNCKDTEYNYKVYKNLEELYMINDNLSKTDIYNIGKKLVDNSLTEKEIEFRNRILNNIKESKEEIEYYEKDIDRYEWYIGAIETSNVYTDVQKKEYTKDYKYQIKWRKREINRLKNTIKFLKYILTD